MLNFLKFKGLLGSKVFVFNANWSLNSSVYVLKLVREQS